LAGAACGILQWALLLLLQDQPFAIGGSPGVTSTGQIGDSDRPGC